MPRPRQIGSRTRLWLPKLLALLAWCSPCGAADLFRDHFSGYPPGWLTRPVGQLNAAIQEYHYLAHRGVPLGPWANAIFWIYTQDRPTAGDRVYIPVRNPDYNESNYRTVVSRPGWAKVPR